MFEDRAISCADCGTEFSFTAGEQEFYAQRGFTEPPRRCPSCRAARKAARQQSSTGLTGGHGSDSYGAGGGFGSGGGYGQAAAYAGEYRERRPREMFEAVCADCGNTASVPFRPSGVKPVYCSDCFQGRR